MKKLLFISTACLLLAQSCSNKKTEGESVLLSNSKNKATCVSFSSDENNQPVVSWCETGEHDTKMFFLSFLDKQQNTFSNPVDVPIEQSATFHEEGMPKIAIKGDGTIVAVYEIAAPTEQNRFAGFVKYIQSFDKGKTWTSPHYLAADTTPGKGHSFASATRLSDGEIGACWLDVAFENAKNGRPVLFAKTNGRNGFNGETVVDSLACQCCRTAISCDGKGNISIMFRDILSDSIRDMSLVTSTDDGKTFSRAMPFTNDGWVINGCPHNGPAVANVGGNSFATWFTGGPNSGVYFAALNSKGEVTDRKTISPNARNIQLCVLPNDIKLVAYNEGQKISDSFYTKIMVNKITGDKMFTMDITPEKSKAGYPVLQALNHDKVVVAWEENDKIYYRVIDINQITALPNYSKAKVVFPAMRKTMAKLSVYKDPVCGMTVKDGVPDTLNYKGKVLGFCSDRCKEKFIASLEEKIKLPEKPVSVKK